MTSNPTSVTVRRPGGFDRNGDPLPGADHVIEGCTWWPRISDEQDRTGGNAVIVGLMLTGPVGTDISPDDRVLFPDDATEWHVEGEPGRFVSPFGGALDHFEVALRRQEG